LTRFFYFGCPHSRLPLRHDISGDWGDAVKTLRTISHYQVVEKLAEMAVVYKAEEVKRYRFVTQLLTDDVAKDGQALALFP
jgi:hypothetical protein